MKKTTLAAMIGVFTAGSFFINLSYAQDPGESPDRAWQQQGGHNDRYADRRHHDRGSHGERNHFTWRGDDFRRGHPAPQRYRGDDYRVDDWRGRGLDEPPRGAHWARIDGNYVLIAAVTGLVTAIVAGNLAGHH